jgi:hypothetical protein
VTFDSLLFFSQTFLHSIAPSCATGYVLSYQYKVNENGPIQQEQNLVPNNYTMAGLEARALRLKVDVRGDDSIQVTPANNHT